MDINNTKIVTKRLTLRILKPHHGDKVLDYFIRNRDFLKEWSPVRGEDYYTLKYHTKGLERELENIKTGSMFKVWIFKNTDNNKVIGSISLNNIVRGAFLSCFLGYQLDKDEINKGYMSEALEAIIKYAFEELGLHRIEANIIPRNKRSLRVTEKLGFYNEGLSKKYLNINGVWEDHIHMVIRNKAME